MTFTITLTEQQVADLVDATAQHNKQAAVMRSEALTPEAFFYMRATGYLDAMSAAHRERVTNEVIASPEVQALIHTRLAAKDRSAAKEPTK